VLSLNSHALHLIYKLSIITTNARAKHNLLSNTNQHKRILLSHWITMALSNGTSTTALIPQSGTASIQHRASLPNPFDLTDDQILDIVYLAHLNDDEICDTDNLYNLVSNIVLRVIPIHFVDHFLFLTFIMFSFFDNTNSVVDWLLQIF